MITPERKRELAINLGIILTKQTLGMTTPESLFPYLIDTDDVGSLPPAEFSSVSRELASLIRTGKPILTFPELYVGTGDGEPAQVPAAGVEQ